MKILLADSHGPIFGKPQGTPNLGLLYLASYARERFPDAEFKYLPQRISLEEHLAEVAAFSPDVYALSFTSYGMAAAFELIDRVKDSNPALPIVVGGAHVSAAPEQTLNDSRADICVVGEGEVTFSEILQALPQLEDRLPTIAGIVYREDGKPKRTALRPMIDDIDTIPYPARDLVDDADYVGLSHRKARPNAEMIVMRGCPFRCIFCSNPVFRGEGPSFRVNSPKYVAAEAEDLYQQGYREIYLHSDELNVHHAWAIEVCQELAALGHPDLFFQCNLRAAPMTPELAQAMKAANFWLVRFGIESANEHVLKNTLKRMAVEQTVEACKMVSQAGIKTWGYLLMFQFWEEEGKLNYERPEDVKRTLAFAHRLWKEGVLNYSSWMYAIPVPGAGLHDVALRHGLIDDTYEAGESWDPSSRLPGVSHREFRMLFLRARFLQARMALKAGDFEMRNWKGIMARMRSALTLRSN